MPLPFPGPNETMVTARSGSPRPRLRQLFTHGMWLLALPAISYAQSLPASIRACAADVDSVRRHACYDREVERILDAQRNESARQKAVTACCVNSGSAARNDSTSRNEANPAQQAIPAQEARTSARKASSTPQASASAQETNPAPHGASAQQEQTTRLRARAAQKHGRLSARVLSIDTSSGGLTLHLDNGEVWKQIGGTAGDLSLRAGDTVTIERHLGSYWLSARHISAMRVREGP